MMGWLMCNWKIISVTALIITGVAGIESGTSGSNVVITGAPSIPSGSILKFQKECGLDCNKLTIDASKNLYNDKKVSKFIKLINDWYASNNYIGSGVKNARVEQGNKLHITCNELRVDEYSPIEIHTYSSAVDKGSKALVFNPPNALATLHGDKLSGKPTDEQIVSGSFLLRKLGLEPGKSFKWDSSKWAVVESCGLFRGKSVVKLVKNPKDDTVTLHVYVIENPTKIIGPFLGNVLNAYKEPVFGLKFQHIDLLGNGIIGTICTCAGLSSEGCGFKSRPYKVVANLTYDIVESFIWSQDKISQPCKVFSIRGFADNDKVGGLFKYNFKLSGSEGYRASITSGISSKGPISCSKLCNLQSLAEFSNSFKMMNCSIETNSSVVGVKESDPWKFKYRGKLKMNVPINKKLYTAIEGAFKTNLDENGQADFEIDLRGSKTSSLGRFNKSYDINLLVYKNIPINLPTAKVEESGTVQVGKGIIGMYFGVGGGVKHLFKENIEKIESTIVANVGLLAGINNARIFIGLPIVRVDDYSKPFNLFPKLDPKISFEISVPINN